MERTMNTKEQKCLQDNMTVEQWLATRKEAGLRINPVTAEVTFTWGQILDPYGVKPDLPPECDQIGRLYWARSPGSDVWVSFYDLPKATLTNLRNRMSRGLVKDALGELDIPNLKR
jgi:hypothetical protein